MCVMAVVGAAPCQCFSPGGIQTTSPGRISSIGLPQRCARPQPAVTIRVWPSGCVCHAVRAPGSNVTLAPTARAGALAWNRGSMRTVPVKYSADPWLDGCEPLRLMFSISNHPCRTAVDHPLCGLGVPGPLHRDLGRGAFDVAEIALGELDGGRRDVLLQAMPLRRPGNRHDPGLLGQQPGERDLGGRRALT